MLFQLEKSPGMIQITFGYDGTSFKITIDKIFNFDPKLSKLLLFIIKTNLFPYNKKVFLFFRKM